jgi:hypothetical protein
MEKENYTKPEIKTEEVDLYAFCAYAGPVQVSQPNYGICCP